MNNFISHLLLIYRYLLNKIHRYLPILYTILIIFFILALLNVQKSSLEWLKYTIYFMRVASYFASFLNGFAVRRCADIVLDLI